MKTILLLVATLMDLGLTVFSIRNPEVVHVDLLVGDVSVAVSVAILGSAFLGALAGGILVALLKGDGRK